MSADNCGDYKVYGSQTTAGTEREQQQALFVAKFHDIYENSYVRQYPNLHSGEQQKNICRPVPQRRLKLSVQPGDCPMDLAKAADCVLLILHDLPTTAQL